MPIGHWALARATRIGIAMTLAASSLGGCGGLGPRTIGIDQIDYATAIGEASKKQVLLNIVKIRYSDLPSFVSVNQLVAGYQMSANATLAAGLANIGNTALQSGNDSSLGLQGTFSDNPTITYGPLAGSDFAQTLLAPLAPSDLFGLIVAGVSVRLALGVGLHSLGDYHNEVWGAAPTGAADPEFVEAIEILDDLRRAGSFHITGQRRPNDKAAATGSDGAEQRASALFVEFVDRRGDPGVRAKEARLRQLLSLDPNLNRFQLSFDLEATGSPDELRLRTRSLIEILGDVASNIDLPEGHGAGDERNGAVRLFAPDVRVRSASAPPGQAFVSVRYLGQWFFIAQDDLRSKQLFTLVMLLATLAEGGKPLQLPVLTIPTG